MLGKTVLLLGVVTLGSVLADSQPDASHAGLRIARRAGAGGLAHGQHERRHHVEDPTLKKRGNNNFGAGYIPNGSDGGVARAKLIRRTHEDASEVVKRTFVRFLS